MSVRARGHYLRRGRAWHTLAFGGFIILIIDALLVIVTQSHQAEVK